MMDARGMDETPWGRVAADEISILLAKMSTPKHPQRVSVPSRMSVFVWYYTSLDVLFQRGSVPTLSADKLPGDRGSRFSTCGVGSGETVPFFLAQLITGIGIVAEWDHLRLWLAVIGSQGREARQRLKLDGPAVEE